MNHEVFVLGGQRIDQKSNMEERLGEMRQGRRKRMRKGAIVSSSPSSPQGMTSWSSSIKICFFLAYRCHGVKQNAKICAIGEQNVINILGGQRIDQKIKKGWWRGRRERIEKGSRERI